MPFGRKQVSNPATEDESDPLLTRLVIRDLPPHLTEKALWDILEPLPDHDEFYFVESGWSLGVKATCRAYINFKDPSEVFNFSERFDGYRVIDSKGLMNRAIVEYAPFQRYPKRKSVKPRHEGPDPLCGTIEKHPNYKKFVCELMEKRNSAKKSMGGTIDIEIPSPKSNVTTTPLLDFITAINQERSDAMPAAGVASYNEYDSRKRGGIRRRYSKRPNRHGKNGANRSDVDGVDGDGLSESVSRDDDGDYGRDYDYGSDDFHVVRRGGGRDREPQGSRGSGRIGDHGGDHGGYRVGRRGGHRSGGQGGGRGNDQ